MWKWGAVSAGVLALLGAAVPITATAEQSSSSLAGLRRGEWNWHYSPTLYLEDLRKSPNQAAPVRPYSLKVAIQHAQSIPLELAVPPIAFVGIGPALWRWGERSFHTGSEGWFGPTTPYGGADKLGHAWGAHVIADFFTWRLQSRGFGTFESAITGSAIAGLSMLAIEIGDGYSTYGFSYIRLFLRRFGIEFSRSWILISSERDSRSTGKAGFSDAVYPDGPRRFRWDWRLQREKISARCEAVRIRTIQGNAVTFY